MKTTGALLAALVFVLFTAVHEHRGAIRGRNEMTQGNLRQLELTRAAKLQPHHTPLADKMGFVRENESGVHQPGADELKVWFRKNQQRFQQSPRISFRQLCFSFARDGGKAQDVAARAFRKVSGQPVDSDAGVANLADHHTLQSYFGDRTPQQVAKVFGTAFTRSLFQLRPGSWQGPIESQSGWHLVWIDSIATGRAPFFLEV